MNMDKKNIFIIDDEKTNIQVITTILKEKLMNISFALDGKRGLEAIARELPDLVLLDLSMPDMDGFEVCKRLKADAATAEIPVIFLTARVESENIVKGFSLGAVDYINRPFLREELLVRISTHLELKESRDLIREQNEELKIKNNELYIMSITDKLTDVYNRLYIMNALTREFSKSKRHLTDLSCILFDIDDFKKFNDKHGYQHGDFILKETAQLVKSILRTEDYFGRYGGEEFLIILPGVTTNEARVVAEKVRQKVESAQYTIEDRSVSISISLGIANINYDIPLSEKELLLFADNALYEAKERGKNQTVAHMELN